MKQPNLSIHKQNTLGTREKRTAGKGTLNLKKERYDVHRNTIETYSGIFKASQLPLSMATY